MKIQKMPKEEVIEPSSAEGANQIVSAPRMNILILFCFEYCKCKDVIATLSYTVLQMLKCVGSCGEARSFSALDALAE